MNVFLGILAFSFLIIVHELGHFMFAKFAGIKVLEFSIFMGPKLFSINRGETLYSIRAIPIGGYVKMEGEEESSDDEMAYNKKSIGARASVIAAGPIMNILMAVLILAFVFSFMGFTTNEIAQVTPGSPITNAGIKEGDIVKKYDGKTVLHPMDISLMLYVSNGEPVDVEVMRGNEREDFTITPEKIYQFGFSAKQDENLNTNVVAKVSPNSPASEGGLMADDKIINLNDTEVNNIDEIRNFLKINKDNPVDVIVIRNGKQVPLRITPKFAQYNLGFIFKNEKGGVINTFKHSVTYTLSSIKNVYYSLSLLIKGKVSANEISGPVGIVSELGNVVEAGPTLFYKFILLLNFTAFISINLGIMNLIPFPALDGSKLLLLLIEGIRKKPLAPNKEAMISMVGFAILIMIMIFTFYNDIFKLVSGG